LKLEDLRTVFDNRIKLVQVEFALREVQQKRNLLISELEPLGIVRLFPEMVKIV
jgi:hypothetical protein